MISDEAPEHPRTYIPIGNYHTVPYRTAPSGTPARPPTNSFGLFFNLISRWTLSTAPLQAGHWPNHLLYWDNTIDQSLPLSEMRPELKGFPPLHCNPVIHTRTHAHMHTHRHHYPSRSDREMRRDIGVMIYEISSSFLGETPAQTRQSHGEPPRVVLMWVAG